MSQTAPRPEQVPNQAPDQAPEMAPYQAFEEPWHAAAFALTVHLHDRGLFSWTEWADCLAAMLADHSRAGSLDGGDDYYTAWLAALQRLLAKAGVAGDDEISAMMAAWTEAYLATPHGQPVTLGVKP